MKLRVAAASLVVLLTFLSVGGVLAAQKDVFPGEIYESRAELLERRDEKEAASIEYMQAARESSVAAAEGGEDAAYLWARAEFLLEKSFTLSVGYGRNPDLLSLLDKLSRSKNTPPSLAGRCNWLCALASLREGDLRQVEKKSEPLGLIRNWLVCGPFDNERGRSFEKDFGPEDWPIGLESAYEGKKGQVKWRQADTVDPLAYVDMAALMRPNTECLAYALALVKSRRQTEAVLRMGSDDGVAAWVNHKEVFRNPSACTADFDQSVCAIRLERGWNVLLLKVGQSTDAWGFRARITDMDGGALAGLRYESRPAKVAAILPSLKPVEFTDELSVPKRGAVSVFADALEKDQANHRACYYLGALLMMRQFLGEDEHYDRQLLRRAVRLAPKEGMYYLALSDAESEHGRSIPDREDNLRRNVLEGLVRLGGEDVLATVGLARHYLAMKNFERALELADKAVKTNPLSGAARFLQMDVFRERKWFAQEDVVAREFAVRCPDNIVGRLREGRMSVAAGNTSRALKAFSAACELNAVDVRAVVGKASALANLGRSEEAIKVFNDYLALKPYTSWVRGKVLEVLRHSGKFDEAVKVADKALAICPADHEAMEHKGYALYASGKEKEARAVWAEALSLQPNLVELKKYLAFLDGEADHRTTDIQDLAAFAEKAGRAEAKAGESHAYLLLEHIVSVNSDGTRTRTIHSIMRVYDREAAGELRHIPVYYNESIERLDVRRARVLHTDGSINAAQISDAYEGRGGPRLLVFPALRKGDVIEIEYTVERFKQDFFGDYFGEIFQFRRNVPVVESRYVVVSPAGRTMYCGQTGGSPEPRVSEDGGKVIRRWEMKNLAAIREVPFAPPMSEISPMVQVSVFRNWDELARWYWHLVKPQNVITPEIRKTVKALIDGKTDDYSKVAAIYGWVSSNIRNVPWEFGVFRYKPYNASAIFSRRFGDCKDHATLLNVMMREAGFEAWPVLINAFPPEELAGRGKEEFSLPVLGYFNHCISYVRAGGRDFWLDATKTYRTIDSVPDMNAGASVVVVTPDGAVMGKIPAQSPQSGLWQDKVKVTIDDDGHATIAQAVTASGKAAVYLRLYFSRPQTRQRALEVLGARSYGPCIAGGKVIYVPRDGGADRVGVKGIVRAKEYAYSEGDGLRFGLPRIFLRGELAKGMPFPQKLGDFARYSRREEDVVLPLMFSLKRHISITWPAGMTLSNRFESVRMEHDFGSLVVEYSRIGSTLTVDMTLEIKSLRISAKDYPAFRRLCLRADMIDETVLRLEDE